MTVGHLTTPTFLAICRLPRLLDSGQTAAFTELVVQLSSSSTYAKRRMAKALCELTQCHDRAERLLEAPCALAALVPLLGGDDIQVLEHAAQVLDHVSVAHGCGSAASQESVQAIGAGLVAVMGNTACSPCVRADAADDIALLCWERSSRRWLGEVEGLLPNLAALLSDSSKFKFIGLECTPQWAAARALQALAKGAANAQAIMWTPGCLTGLVVLLEGAAGPWEQQAAAGALYRLTYYAPSWRAAMASIPGLVRGLVNVLEDLGSMLVAQQWAAGAIADLAQEPSSRRKVGRQPGLLSSLAYLLWGKCTGVQRLAAKALRNLAAAPATAQTMGDIHSCTAGLARLLHGQAGVKAQEHAAAALYHVAAAASDGPASIESYSCVLEALQQLARTSSRSSTSSSGSRSRSFLRAQSWASAALMELGEAPVQQVTGPAGRPRRRRSNMTRSSAAATAATSRTDEVFQALQRPVEEFAAALQGAQQRLVDLMAQGGELVPHAAVAGPLLQQVCSLVPLMADAASVVVAQRLNQGRAPVTISLDVHAQRTGQAVDRVNDGLRGLQAFRPLGLPITLEVITGRGNHSAGRGAAVRAAVRRHLEQAGIPYTVPPHNDGVVHVCAADMPPGWYPGAMGQLQR